MTRREELLQRAHGAEDEAMSYVAARCSREVIAQAFADAAAAYRELGIFSAAAKNERHALSYGWRP